MDHNYRSKLSLLAKYDDMCRYLESNASNEKELHKILASFEINRLKWQECSQKLNDSLRKNESLERENQQLKRKLAKLREELRLSAERYQQTMKESHNLRHILTTIREFVVDDPNDKDGGIGTTTTTTTTSGTSDHNESIILDLNRNYVQKRNENRMTSVKHLNNHDQVRYILNHTDDLVKRQNASTNQYRLPSVPIDDDDCDDTVLNYQLCNDLERNIESPDTYYVGELNSRVKTTSQQQQPPKPYTQSSTNQQFQDSDLLSSIAQNFNKLSRMTTTEHLYDHHNDADDEKNSKSDDYDAYEYGPYKADQKKNVDDEDCRTTKHNAALNSTINTEPNRTIDGHHQYFTPKSVSSPTTARYFNSCASAKKTPKIKMDLSRLDGRPHTLQLKKVFKPNMICVPCGKTIGFCAKYLVCSDCRTMSHVNCQVGLSLPCIPHYTPRGINRTGSHMLMVGDFTAPDTRPFVPPLLVHCCNEIKKRAMHEQGLYRKCGNDRDVRELKARFLHTKTGPPNIRKTDRHVICGVIKMFLRDLDDPLITRILWHDFIRATANTDQEKSTILLKRAIEQLPDANRDTLAFLILHLIEVADHSDQNRMSLKSLAKIFGPTVIGYSIANPPLNSMIAENVQQIHTMDCLLRLSKEFWQQILTDPDTLKQNNAKNFQSPRSVVGGRTAANISALSPYSFRSANSSVYVTPAKVKSANSAHNTAAINRNRLFLDPIF